MKEEDRDSFKYRKSIIVEEKVTKEFAQRFNIKEGSTILMLPLPENKNQLIDQFEKYYAQMWFESLQYHFKEKRCRGIMKERLIVEELKILNDFIAKTKEVSLGDALEKNIQSDYHEYLRLEAGYYSKSNIELKPYDEFYNVDSDRIYGKFFLYKKWLEQELRKYQNNDTLDKAELDDRLFKLINNIFKGDHQKYELLKYLSDNFTSSNKKFNDLTKYNHIYRYFNRLENNNIEKGHIRT